MNKDIVNTNSEGAYHGYVKLYRGYWLSIRGNWINNEPIGYLEWHSSFKETTYYIQ